MAFKKKISYCISIY